ncbi:ArnT family glycosyltransferase [Caenimonas terrae]|uniref:ArnT family glycosyltransferase n=1 Tax=Caenimonas terrae TaxID=696074 RepID=A0ABW0NGN4_9BURK
MLPDRPIDRTSRLLLAALLLLGLTRLLSLAFYPLMDMTEARYADIARRMAASGDWVTPTLVDLRAFWGKPALSFWATASGIKLFGATAWAARMPHFLMGVGVAVLVWFHGREHSSRLAWQAVALLAGSLLFLLSAGAVMTDMALALGTTMAMSGFWWCMSGRGRLLPPVILFTGLAIGLLAKGPLTLVLCGAPIGAWLLWERQWAQAWRRVPWVWGLLAVAVMVLPWYLLAESRSPGFLEYFIVGEHIYRFLVRGWKGDLYSNAHGMPLGTVWLFALAAALPWVLVLPAARLAGALRHGSVLERPHFRYLLLWALWPCVFFTVAGNILWTYVLPAMPALALLAAGWTAAASRPLRMDRLLATVLLLLALAVPALLAAGTRAGLFDEHSLVPLVRAYEQMAQPGDTLMEVPSVSFSTDFYSQGRARGLRYGEDLPVLAGSGATYVIIANDRWELLPRQLREQVTQVAATPSYKLFRWSGAGATPAGKPSDDPAGR